MKTMEIHTRLPSDTGGYTQDMTIASTLNQSAAAILERCDGKRSLAAVASDLEQAFNQTDLAPDVIAFVKIAVEQRWLEVS